MCGRINQSTPKVWRRAFQELLFPDELSSFNVAPSMALAAARCGTEGMREAASLKWGLLPSWVDDPKAFPKPINAKAETVARLPTFRFAFAQRRCVVPVDGFYEWTREGGKVRQRFHIHHADAERPLLLAGLWERWGSDGTPVESACVLTTAPNGVMAPIHQRMPVLLDAEGVERWLDPKAKSAALAKLLGPCPDDWLAADPVSAWGNKVGNDGPKCLEP